jgi:anti-sigma factor RsiW
MKEDMNRQSCSREDDLIGFLYSELSEGEAQTFRKHMQDCASCRAQLSSFTNIRESIVAWRNESLGVRTTDATVASVDRQGPSAIAAFRGFFNLSPLWMKGAVAFASILFCIFAGLAMARLRETPSEVITKGQQQRSEQELNALIERRVQDEVRRYKETQQAAIASRKVNTLSDQMSGTRTNHRGTKRTANAPSQNARRPLTKGEREELAADLRLIPGANSTELELLDDRINQ